MGHSFRSRLEHDLDGGVSVIQMKDLTDDNRLDVSDLAVVDLKNLKESHRVKAQDLAFRSRGQTNKAAIINRHFDEAVIAAPLLRIRVKIEGILPEYLCWFINQPVSQRFLQSRATGTAARMIGKTAVESLKVVIPSLEKQRKIIELERLAIAEQRLMKEIAEIKNQYVEGVLMQYASGS